MKLEAALKVDDVFDKLYLDTAIIGTGNQNNLVCLEFWRISSKYLLKRVRI